MTPWIALTVLLAADALAGARVHIPVVKSGGNVKSVPALSGLGLSSPLMGSVPLANLGSTMKGAPGAPAVLALSQPDSVAAPEAVLAPKALDAAPAAPVSATGKIDGTLPTTRSEDAEAVPTGALNSAEWAVAAPEARIEALFNGDKRRSWLERVVSAEPLRPSRPRLSQGSARLSERYAEPPLVARARLTREAVAKVGGGGAVVAFIAAAGLPFLLLGAATVAGLYLYGRRALRAVDFSLQSSVVHFTALEKRAQRLMDELTEAKGLQRVKVHVIARNDVNALYNNAHPNIVILNKGADILGDKALKAILAHELGHLKFKDDFRAELLALATMVGFLIGAAPLLLLKAGLLHGSLAAAVPAWLLGAPMLPSLALALAGMALAGAAILALLSLPRLREFRADDFGAWMTNSRTMADMLRWDLSRRRGQRTLWGLLTSTHPDTAQRIVELRGRGSE